MEIKVIFQNRNNGKFISYFTRNKNGASIARLTKYWDSAKKFRIKDIDEDMWINVYSKNLNTLPEVQRLRESRGLSVKRYKAINRQKYLDEYGEQLFD